MFSVSTLLRKIEQVFMGIMVLFLKLDASTLYLLWKLMNSKIYHFLDLEK